MDINKILEKYEKIILDKGNRKLFQINIKWKKEISTKPGVYAFFEKNKIIYIGETGSLKGRMSEVHRTLNHTFRQSIGNKKFSNIKGFTEATSKKKFPEHIETMVNKYMLKLHVAMVPIMFGRAEVEEYLIEKYKPEYNSKEKRKSV